MCAHHSHTAIRHERKITDIDISVCQALNEPHQIPLGVQFGEVHVVFSSARQGLTKHSVASFKGSCHIQRTLCILHEKRRMRNVACLNHRRRGARNIHRQVGDFKRGFGTIPTDRQTHTLIACELAIQLASWSDQKNLPNPFCYILYITINTITGFQPVGRLNSGCCE